MSTRVKLNKLEQMRVSSVEKAFCYTRPETTSGDFVGLMEPITFTVSEVSRLSELTGRRSINI